jgi:hypothetical protein
MGHSSRIQSFKGLPSRRLIDDTGELWPVQDQVLRQRLGTSLAGAALVDYVIVNMGWIEVSTSADRFGVRCRPRLVGQRGIAALLYSMHDAAPERISLSVLGHDWQYSIHRTPVEVATIIGGMANITAVASDAGKRALINREIAPDTSPLFVGFQTIAAQAERANSIEELVDPLNAAFRGRWCICHIEPPKVIMDRVGNGFTPFNPGWKQQATGVASLDTYADENYGAWIAHQRQWVAQTRQTIFDEVDAIVSFPRLGETRLQYSRATFPLHLASGADYIVSAARTDSGINLRN